MPKYADHDAYIAAAPEFARPILEKIRAWYHAAYPKIEEELKWGAPAFMAGGIVGGMAAFKKHVSVGFWRAREIEGIEAVMPGDRGGSFAGSKIASVKELPAATVFKSLVKKAVALNLELAAQPKSAKKKATRKAAKPVVVPPELVAALRKNDKARAAFESFPPSCQREYSDWIAEAKRDETRAKRLATAIEWLSEGKRRHWKYENC